MSWLNNYEAATKGIVAQITNFFTEMAEEGVELAPQTKLLLECARSELLVIYYARRGVKAGKQKYCGGYGDPEAGYPENMLSHDIDCDLDEDCNGPLL